MKPNWNLQYGEDRDLSVTNILGFVGYKEHDTYWTKNVREISCFMDVVKALYVNDKALQEGSSAVGSPPVS